MSQINSENEIAKVYKILKQNEWLQFQKEGAFQGSDADHRDGFIHLSTADQVKGVIGRYYSNSAEPLYIAEFSDPAFIRDLKWEETSSGGLYPHLYNAPLKFDQISKVKQLDPHQL